MTMPRVGCLLAGLAARLGAALRLCAGGLSILSVAHALVVMASAAVAMLATATGGLIVSDWQADVQSRQAWAQLGLPPAELSLQADAATAWDIDPDHRVSQDNEALRQILRAHRYMSPRVSGDASAAMTSARLAAALGATDRANGTGVSTEKAYRQPLPRLCSVNLGSVETVVPSWQCKLRVKRVAARSRLVANSGNWPAWSSRGSRLPVAHSADIIVLSKGDEAEPPADASVAGTECENTTPPSCRGPPHVAARRSRTAKVTPAQQPAEPDTRAPHAGTRSAIDPIVRDDLGEPIPVCAAELDVIETYLGHLMQDLFASTDDPEPAQA